MQPTEQHPDPDQRCACGRACSAASPVTHVFASGTYRFLRCECGREWTQRVASPNHAEPVSSDEVLEVHERLASFQGTLDDLVRAKRD